MKDFFEKRRVVVVAGFLPVDEGVLLARAGGFASKAIFAEYFGMPSWEVPFGASPERVLTEEFGKYVGVSAKAETPAAVDAYIVNDGGVQVLEITYLLSADQKQIAALPLSQRNDLAIVKEAELDAFVISERIKDTIKECFAFRKENS